MLISKNDQTFPMLLVVMKVWVNKLNIFWQQKMDTIPKVEFNQYKTTPPLKVRGTFITFQLSTLSS